MPQNIMAQIMLLNHWTVETAHSIWILNLSNEILLNQSIKQKNYGFFFKWFDHS